MLKSPSSIHCRDSNSWPLEHESPLITTRPGRFYVLQSDLEVDHGRDWFKARILPAILFLIGNPRTLFRLFSVFSNKQYNLYNESMRKNIHPVSGAGIRTHDLLNTSCLPWPLDQGGPALIMLFFFKKMGQSRLFCFFSFFSCYNFNTNWKKLRWCAWDSNPGPQDGRRRRNHRAMAAFVTSF